MNLTLVRTDFRADGIFGELKDEKSKVIAYTLEHAYQQDDGSFAPKVPVGVYTCNRSSHLLHGMTNPFETFEVLSVPGHTGVLVHWGNFNKDSEGCILVGEAIMPSPKGQMITNSRAIFAEFMQTETGINQFQLTVIA